MIGNRGAEEDQRVNRQIIVMGRKKSLWMTTGEEKEEEAQEEEKTRGGRGTTRLRGKRMEYGSERERETEKGKR